MKPNRLWAVALALTCFIAGPARAAPWEDAVRAYLGKLAVTSKNGSPAHGMNPDPHFITIDPAEWFDTEQAAVSGFSWGSRPDRVVVGGAFRSYSAGAPWAFGIATESIAAQDSNATLVGAEHMLVSRNPNSTAPKVALNPILITFVAGDAAPGSNENSRYVQLDAQARQPGGPPAGWQTFNYFGRDSLDRTLTRPYVVLNDLSDVVMAETWVPVYLYTWHCGGLGSGVCGLRLNGSSLEVWRDIKGVPQLVRTL
jgi:hypothetical protein